MIRTEFSIRQAIERTALYVHIPWCVRKCPYCDFNSHRAPDTLPVDRYVRALIDDLNQELASGRRPIIDTVFFGGGTPSLFPPEAIGRILRAASALAEIPADAEITIEANPGTIERGRFAGYRDAGVSRISLGAQSFDAEALRTLGRIHGPDDTRRAVDELIAAGFEDFNLDLMFGLPGQTLAGAVRDLREALALGPSHLSHYQLTLEPGTPFERRPPPAIPDQDETAAIHESCGVLLVENGYQRYEVSAHARPGRQCRHNVNYWKFGDYIGLGAGAHGKRTSPDGVLRSTRPRGPGEYMSAIENRLPAASVSPVPPEQLPFEFMLNALRLCDGFEAGDYQTRTGLEFATVEPTLHRLYARGLVERVGARWKTTPAGFDFLNDVVAAFLPDSKPAGAGRAQP